jgi:hypothetical protein
MSSTIKSRLRGKRGGSLLNYIRQKKTKYNTTSHLNKTNKSEWENVAHPWTLEEMPYTETLANENGFVLLDTETSSKGKGKYKAKTSSKGKGKSKAKTSSKGKGKSKAKTSSKGKGKSKAKTSESKSGNVNTNAPRGSHKTESGSNIERSGSNVFYNALEEYENAKNAKNAKNAINAKNAKNAIKTKCSTPVKDLGELDEAFKRYWLRTIKKEWGWLKQPLINAALSSYGIELKDNFKDTIKGLKKSKSFDTIRESMLQLDSIVKMANSAKMSDKAFMKLIKEEIGDTIFGRIKKHSYIENPDELKKIITLINACYLASL